jgi:hypothetical protein
MSYQLRPISGFTNRYMISDDGRVYSLVRKRFLKPNITANGFSFHRLKNDEGKSKTFVIHREVIRTFVKENLTFSDLVLFKDEDKQNCALNNLVVMNRAQFAYFYNVFEGTMREFLEGFYTVVKSNPQAAD